MLLFLREFGELADVLGDALNDVGQDGVVGVVHLVFLEALERHFEHILLDLLLVLVVGPVQGAADVRQDLVDDLPLVDLLVGLGLLEDVEGPAVEVGLQVDLLVDEELHDGAVPDRLVLAVQGLELQLALGDGHELTHLGLDVVVVVGLQVLHLVLEDAPVEAAQQWPRSEDGYLTRDFLPSSHQYR